MLVSKDGYSQKLQYKHYNEKKKEGGHGGWVKDMEFSGVLKKIASGFSKD